MTKPVTRGAPVVWYGLDHVPTAGEHAAGGIVKLRHLDAHFPNTPDRFNVLYLVTSRLPEAADAVAWWAHQRGAKVVVNQNGVAYPAWHGPGWAQVNAPMMSLLEVADHVFYQSAFCRMSADRFAVPAARTAEILYNAVDTTVFCPAAPPRDARPLVLLLGGSQDQRYRFDAAIATLAKVVARGHDARLIVTGRLRWSTDVDACRAQAAAAVAALSLTDRVELTGPYMQRDAPALFQRADILLHTKYNDPCPAVVIEALSCGLPVVYSASGGVPELVGPDAGIGIPAPLSWEREIAPDPEQLADAVERVSQVGRYRDAARQRAVDRFDLAPWMGRHAAVFAALAS
jgi:glycosyltransferase involved in cell wall biosynthesis